MGWLRGCSGTVLIGLVAGTVACGGEGAAVAPGGGVVADETLVQILPKWKLPGDYRIPGKADQYDDYRAAHPEWYALTVPPAKEGFRAATEWQEMMGVLLGFPGTQGTAVNNSMAKMVVQGAGVVDWYVVVPNALAQTTFVNVLKSNGLSQATIDAKVRFLRFSLDSIWMIDYGPFPLVAPDGSVAFADFRYYHQRLHDDAIPTKVGNWLGITTYRAGLDWEGGNFQMDEVGTCYTTQGTFWQNAEKTEAEVKDVLSRYLGCKTLIVLAPLQDGTSHMDMFSKLASKNVFVLGRATTATGTTTTINTLEQNNSILTAAVLADGTKLTVHRIPMPNQKDGNWRTYTNSTFANGVNLWPIYSINKDLEAQALDVWKAAMPDWNHVGILSDTVITWGGAMHCISRAMPAGTYAKWVADGTCSGGTCQAPAGGYDGSCTSNADCVGPKWLCALPDCGSLPQTCGGITWEGCCDGETLKYCEDNQLVTQNCSGDPLCGWNASKGFYDCRTNGGADPSGQFPKACVTCTPNCAVKVCGDDGCGGSCGTCPAGTHCDAGYCVPVVIEVVPDSAIPDNADVACTPDCEGRECGPDGCGGSCGMCQGGFVCQAGQCVGCTPDCTERECGNDGCGGSCGTCAVGETCLAGQCVPVVADLAADIATPDTSQPDVACTPDCAGRQCGPDGCGATCGACPLGFSCSVQGQCVAQLVPDISTSDTGATDVAGGDAASSDPGTGGGKSSGGCTTTGRGTPWPAGLVLTGLLFLGLRRRSCAA